MPTVSNTRSSVTTPTPTATRPGEAATNRQGIPLGLIAAQEAQKAKYVDANGKPTTVRYSGRDMPFGEADRMSLPKGSAKALLRELGESGDAGNAIVVANNAHLHTLTYCYGTHKPMEAWLTKVPADGKLSISLIGTPSTHVGSTDGARQKNFDTYAKTNNYNVEITYPDGSREVKKFDVDGNSPPKYGNSNPAPKGKPASLSPEVEIDLKKWAGKGDITIRGWADGSSPGGYIEHRATILHV